MRISGLFLTIVAGIVFAAREQYAQYPKARHAVQKGSSKNYVVTELKAPEDELVALGQTTVYTTVPFRTITFTVTSTTTSTVTSTSRLVQVTTVEIPFIATSTNYSYISMTETFSQFVTETRFGTVTETITDATTLTFPTASFSETSTSWITFFTDTTNTSTSVTGTETITIPTTVIEWITEFTTTFVETILPPTTLHPSSVEWETTTELYPVYETTPSTSVVVSWTTTVIVTTITL